MFIDGKTDSTPLIIILDADDVVLAQVTASLDFDQFQQNMEGFDLLLDPAVVKRLSDATRWAR